MCFVCTLCVFVCVFLLFDVAVAEDEDEPLVNEHSAIRYGAANSSSESENDGQSVGHKHTKKG